jgi:membrane-associated phospholipid phosphatase
MKAWKTFVLGAGIIFICGIALTFVGDKGYFLKWLTAYRHPVADYYFYHVTKLGEPPGFIMIGLLLWMHSWRRMLIIPILGGLVTLVSYILKNIFSHERPLLYLNRTGWDGPMAVLDYNLLTGHASFPSGHSMAAWALFTLTAVLIRKNWVSFICLFLAVSVSISRVYLMVHFLQDVVAGAVVGFAVGYGIFYVYELWMKRIGTVTLPVEEKA